MSWVLRPWQIRDSWHVLSVYEETGIYQSKSKDANNFTVLERVHESDIEFSLESSSEQPKKELKIILKKMWVNETQ